MSESEVRALRDRVFFVPASDVGWNATKHNWMRQDSIEWLIDHQHWRYGD